MAVVELEELSHIVLHAAVEFFAQQEPVKLTGFAPLSLLAEFLAHEEQLLAAVSCHEGVAHTEVGVLVYLVAGHLLDHGTLEVDDFVMGQGQDIVL